MSQRALGTASGVGHATIQALERGSGLPTIKTVEALATALHISPGWLGFREGNSQAVTLDVAADFDPVAILSQVQEAISRNKPIEQSGACAIGWESCAIKRPLSRRCRSFRLRKRSPWPLAVYPWMLWGSAAAQQNTKLPWHAC